MRSAPPPLYDVHLEYQTRRAANKCPPPHRTMGPLNDGEPCWDPLLYLPRLSGVTEFPLKNEKMAVRYPDITPWPFTSQDGGRGRKQVGSLQI